jgi:hypothetical protein
MVRTVLGQLWLSIFQSNNYYIIIIIIIIIISLSLVRGLFSLVLLLLNQR